MVTKQTVTGLLVGLLTIFLSSRVHHFFCKGSAVF